MTLEVTARKLLLASQRDLADNSYDIERTTAKLARLEQERAQLLAGILELETFITERSEQTKGER